MLIPVAHGRSQKPISDVSEIDYDDGEWPSSEKNWAKNQSQIIQETEDCLKQNTGPFIYRREIKNAVNLSVTGLNLLHRLSSVVISPPSKIMPLV